MVRYKVRIRFRKAGDLRLISHHDLMRCFERMLRRAEVPFHSTQGFNPRPRLVFALSLPLGIVGCDEIADLELTAEFPPEEIRDRLNRMAPAGLELLSVHPVSAKAAPLARLACYRLPVPPERRAGVCERAAVLLAASECWVERTRPQPRRFDLRPLLADLRVRDDSLEMDLVVTPTGTVRPDEVLDALDLADLLEAGAVLERTRLELVNENSLSTLPTSGNDPASAATQRAATATGLPGIGDESGDPAQGPPAAKWAWLNEEGNA